MMSRKVGKRFYTALAIGFLLLMVLVACQPTLVEETEFTVAPQQDEGSDETQPTLEEAEDVGAGQATAPEDLEGTTVPLEIEATHQPIPQKDAPGELLVAAAKKDLAQRMNIPEDVIQVQAADAVEWPDAGLGCPQPDQEYAQVVTPGYLILLKTEDGQLYAYHTDRRGRMVLCSLEEGGDAILLTPIPIKPDEIQDGVPWVPVD